MDLVNATPTIKEHYSPLLQAFHKDCNPFAAEVHFFLSAVLLLSGPFSVILLFPLPISSRRVDFTRRLICFTVG